MTQGWGVALLGWVDRGDRALTRRDVEASTRIACRDDDARSTGVGE